MVAFPSLTRVDPSNAAQMRAAMMPLIRPWFSDADSGAWCHVISPKDKVVVTNIENGTQTVTVTPIWSGYMRVQPLRTALNSKQPTNDTTTRVVQFWKDIEENEPDLVPGLQIVIEDGLNDPSLELYQYVITGSINASDAWQRTIETNVNLESRPNYDMSSWPKPGGGDDPIGFGLGIFGTGMFGR